MAKHQVHCPIDKVKKIILNEYPEFYTMSEIAKRNIIAFFVKPIHHDDVIKFMNNETEE